MNDELPPMIIVGRSLADYIQCGQRPDPNVTIAQCHACGTPITLSPGGVAMLSEGATQRPVIVLCNPCTVAVVPEDAVPTMTEYASAQIERSEWARWNLNRILRKIRP